MEQTRVIIAIALSLLVFIVWNVFFPKTPSQQPEKQATIERQDKSSTDSEKDTALIPIDSASPESDEPEIVMERNPRQISVETPLYRAIITEKGALFKSFVLYKYRETVEKSSPPKELVPQENGSGTILLSMKNGSMKGLKNALFTVDQPGDVIKVSENKKTLKFVWRSRQGVVVEKQYSFSPDTYLVQMDTIIKNGSGKEIKDHPVLALSQKELGEKRTFGFEGPSAFVDDNLEQVKQKGIDENKEIKGKIHWIAGESRYFISSIIPKTPLDAKMKVVKKEEGYDNELIYPEIVIPSGSQKNIEAFLFMGPKSLSILNSLPFDLNEAITFGWFTIIAKPCLYFMNFIHGYIPNYGIAIIILTIFSKILLWPLGSKSYKSMNEMKKLQPLMAEIREKCKDDKKQMNQEIMGLYRTYKINPMGGCLPMLLQMPVFFALYRMLYQAIELRHAPFLLWINDLSAPDRLFNFGISIPYMQPPIGIPVLTLIMGASMLLQQKMSPPPGDPAQAKMMMIMPIVFTFIFINFSSGLVLYWLTSNIISMAQQYYIQKKYA